MAGTSGTSHTDRKYMYDHSQSFPRLERNTPAREGLRNGKAEAPPVLSFGEVALFRIKGKENCRGLRFERFSTERRFDEAPEVL